MNIYLFWQHEIHALHPNDEHTLQAMAMCYRDVNRRTDVFC